MSAKKEPTFEEVISQALSGFDGPVQIEELVNKALKIRMPTAKDPHKSMRNHIREERGKSLIYLDKKTVLPISLAYNGIRFRLEISRQFAQKGLLPLEKFASYHIQHAFKEPTFLNKNGKKIKYTLEEKKQTGASFFGGVYETTIYYADLNPWIKKEKPSRKDHLLVTILDWDKNVFQLEIEPYKKQNIALLEKRNQLLADIFFDLLENEYRDSIPVFKAVPNAYARLPEKEGYPPFEYETIIKNDKRMISNGWKIEYSDGRLSPLSLMLSEEDEREEPPLVPVSKEMAKSVYRFKANLSRKKSIWRRIDIQGKQVLEELMHELINAFDHDPYHLSAFWKLVRRGNSKRFREVEIANINRFKKSESKGEDTPIAALGLRIGDRLKFVHDFGDWHEHILELEEIVDAEEDKEYPCIIAKNKPRYRYCVHCKEQGKKTVAIYDCFTCYNKEEKDVLVCEDCAEKYHKEHYLEEILY